MSRACHWILMKVFFTLELTCLNHHKLYGIMKDIIIKRKDGRNPLKDMDKGE